MLQALEDIFKPCETGTRIIKIDHANFKIIDCPHWDSHMEYMLKSKIPNSVLYISSSSTSLSGFEIVITKPDTYDIAVWAVIIGVMAAFLFVLYQDVIHM